MSKGSPVIETRKLSKKFRIGTSQRLTLFSTIRQRVGGDGPGRELWALRDITFSVDRGDMVAVLGPNGAGKTTLLRVLAGIMHPTSGFRSVSDEVSCLFELGLGFNPKFTALENIYLYGALHGLSRREVDRILPEIVEFSGLDDFMGAKLGEFSSGMRARLAFATVIRTVKGVVMVDEVLSVGDAAFQSKCIAAFERILNEGNTILFVSHGLGSARALCNKGLFIDKGRQMAFGGIDEVEARFVETMETRRNTKV